MRLFYYLCERWGRTRSKNYDYFVRPLIRVESRTQGSKPRTALPRTDPLKAKDQGHNVEVTSKKRSLLLNNQNFPAISSVFQEKTVFKNSLISAYTLLYYAY